MLPTDMWKERLSFIWYNDAEIFDFTDADFDALAKSYADSGITIVITFSCTHFRYSFYEHWDRIFACIKKLTDACHKYGIKVVEHASSNLTFSTKTDEDTEYAHSILHTRKAKPEHWAGFAEFNRNDDAVVNNGHMIKEFRQIDGRTGEWTVSNYHGYCFCYNNPDYRESYFAYLDELYDRTGIDGYMADDVQYPANGNSCACEHCRKLFKEQTGYDLPYPDKWSEFYGDYSNPAFVAWKRFKIESTERFERDIYNHFLERGVKMLRPNYISSIVMSNWSSHNFEYAADIWDFTFQENVFSSIIRYSYPHYMVEALQRYAMCEWKGSPSLSLFYPDRHDSFYFSWALSMLWGQLLLATAEGTHNTDYEKEFRAFEAAHSSLYTDPKKQSDITFYHSAKTRDFTASHPNMALMFSAAECAYLAGYSCDMTFDYSRDEDFFKHKRIVCAGVSMVSDAELDRFAEFVNNGGELIILGEFATRREDGTPRTFSETVMRMGDGFKSVTYMPNYDFAVTWHGAKIMRMKVPDSFTDCDFDPVGQMKNAGKKLFGTLIGEDNKTVSYTGTEAELMLCSFKIDGGYTVNIVNATGCIPESGTHTVSHHDTIPAFMKSAPKLDTFTVKVKCDSAVGVKLYSPEFDGEVTLPFMMRDGYAEIVVPGGYFGGYGVIEICAE